MSKDIDSLVLNNIRLVDYVLNKLNVTNIEYEDLFSIGTIGLIKAVKTYNPDKSKFSTYSCQCIKNEINLFLRKQPQVIVVSLDEPILNREDRIALSEIIPDPSSNFTEQIELDEMDTNSLKRIIEITLNYLEGIHRIIMLYSISGEKQVWIHEKLGISKQIVSKSIRKSVSRIRTQIKNETFKYNKKFFIVDITKRGYQISFSTQNTNSFCKAFAQFLLKTGKNHNVPEFEVSHNEDRTTITMYSDIRCMELIADILCEADNFKVDFKEIQTYDTTVLIEK